MNDNSHSRLTIIALISALVVVVLFTADTRLDLQISALFTDGQGHFLPPQWGWVKRLNDTLRITLIVLAWGTVFFAGLAALRRWNLASNLRNWGFAALVFFTGPGLIVNLFLKALSGRARPTEISEFGGSAQFTPVAQFTDQCASNCSFSSGEVATTSGFVIVVLALIWPQIAPRWQKPAVLAGAVLIVLSILLRVGLGRHFLSDALSSVAISAFVALIFYRLLQIDRARLDFTPANLSADLAAGRRSLRAWRRR